MATVTIEEAQAKLPDLIHRMFPGEQLVITEKAIPVARMVPSLNTLPVASRFLM